MNLLKQLATLLLSLGLCIACGHGEDEWQAQLDRYSKLDAEYADEHRTREALAQELEEQQRLVAELTSKLQEMGVNVEELSDRLETEGTEKARLVSDVDELKNALEEYKRRAAQLDKIRKRFEVLRDKLQKLTRFGLKVAIRHNRMVISLPGDVLFTSGSAELSKEGLSVLDAVAGVIRSDEQLSQRYFQIAGHTDGVPLRGGPFKDNWGLSAMRARSVLVYLIAPLDDRHGGGGLSAERLHAAGYGETDPVGSNDSPDGKQANRRVELVLMPDVSEMLDLKGLL